MQNLNLLVLRCADIEATKRFYEVIGMSFIRHAHGNGPEHLAHEDARGVFELYPVKEHQPDRTGVGFLTDDLQASHSRFATAGFEPGAILHNEWGTSFVVRDPDGRRVEIKASE